MTKISALKKLITDQLLYSPFETACFIKWTNSLEQREETYEEKMSRDYFLALGLNYALWSPTSFIGYYIIPIKYRALYIMISSLIIDTFSSYATHNNLKQKFEKIIF